MAYTAPTTQPVGHIVTSTEWNNHLVENVKYLYGTRGYTSIATAQTTIGTSYQTLTTPDSVSGIVVAAGQVVQVLYQALWQESSAGAGHAAIFISGSQMQGQQAVSGRGPVAQSARLNGSTAVDAPLFTVGGGLVSVKPGGAYGSDVGTGQAFGFNTNATGTTDDISLDANGSVFGFSAPAILGGPAYLMVDPGTYTISVQYQATSGTVTAKERKLFVRTESY